MYESHRSRPLSRRRFYYRILRHAGIVAVIAIASLSVGMAGYHGFEEMSWTDAFANAAMILSGMGPLSELKTAGGKIFAGCYALFSGITFISVAGILLAPVAHRVMHRFHFDEEKPRDK